MKLQSTKLFVAFSAVAVVAAIIAGLIVIGSPSEIRMHRFDEKRAVDLRSISVAISAYRRTHENFPRKLDDLRRSQPTAGFSFSLKDPTGRPYEYAIKNDSSYELCAYFDTATDKMTGSGAFRSIFDKHGLGRQCFTREAKPAVRR